MPVLPLAAWLDSYQTELRAALDRAAEQQFRFVQANAARDELDPRRWPPSARRHLRRYLRDRGLVLQGLTLQFPGAGLADPREADSRVARLRATLELCADLGVRRAGVTLSGRADPATADLARELLGVVAAEADRVSVLTTVIDPGSPHDLPSAVRAAGAPLLRAGLDTATRPGGGVSPDDLAAAGDVFLRDGRPRPHGFEETEFGAGEVDFGRWLADLTTAAPDAGLVLRHDTPGRVDALRAGRVYMESLLGWSPRP